MAGGSFKLILPKDDKKRQKIVEEVWKRVREGSKKYFDYSEKRLEDIMENLKNHFIDKPDVKYIYFYFWTSLREFMDTEKWRKFTSIFKEGPFQHENYPNHYKVNLYYVNDKESKKKLLKFMENLRDNVIAASSNNENLISVGETSDFQIIMLVRLAREYDLPLVYSY